MSVIIPTRNRAALLGAALDSISQQTLDPSAWEVIVIDNGSSDSTRSVVEQFHGRIEHLRYVFAAEPGLHVGRHIGYREARGEVLVFADDDIKASPAWLTAIAESFADEQVVLVGGQCLPDFECDPPAWLHTMWAPNAAGERMVAALSVVDLGVESRPVNPLLVFGCNLSIRRSTLLDAGGFHPDGMPEEIIYFRGDGETHVSQYIAAKGLKATYNPRASVLHQVSRSRMTYEYFCRRAFAQGISDSFTSLRADAPGDSPNVGAQPVERPSAQGLGERARSTYWRARSFAKRLLLHKRAAATDSGPTDPTLVKIRAGVTASHQAGIRFHQNLVHRLPALADWVRRPHYWECELPELRQPDGSTMPRVSIDEELRRAGIVS